MRMFYTHKYIKQMRQQIVFCRRRLEKAKHIYLIGIGGVGMSGLAYLLKEKGYKVSGSDIASGRRLDSLKQRGIKVYLGHDPQRAEGKDLVCYSSAVKEDNPELKAARQRGIFTVPRGLLLACLAQEEKVIAVAGSHGKTTTTALTGFLLEKMGIKGSTFLGGLLQGRKISAAWGRDVFVIETDESDGSFNFIRPYYSLITNIDREHLNFYRYSWDKLYGAFAAFAARAEGAVIGCADEKPVAGIIARLRRKGNITYGIKKGDFRAENIKILPFASSFDLYFSGRKLLRLRIPLGGRHNILNTLAAVSAVAAFCLSGRLTYKDVKGVCRRIKRVIGGFPGVKRRLEVLGRKKGVIFISDYAHHPSEIKAAIKAARAVKPSRLVVVFQPHRPSRLKSLITDFAGAFYGSTLLIVTDVYLASEKPLQGADSVSLIRSLRYPSRRNIIYLPKDRLKTEVVHFLKKGDMVLALGAGDIDAVVRAVYKYF